MKKNSKDNKQHENFKTCESEDNESDGSVFSYNSKTHATSVSSLNLNFLFNFFINLYLIFLNKSMLFNVC